MSVNPYLDEFLAIMQPAPLEEYLFEHWVERPEYDIMHCKDNDLPYKSPFAAREELCRRYAWAVPDEAALNAIAALGMPVVEIGAGLGYWRSLLEGMDVEGNAFDREPGDNHWCKGTPFTQVHCGDHRALFPIKDENHALMLCWPPMSEMAAKCVETFKGNTVIYIGEDIGGCTADGKFFELLTGETPGDVDADGDWQDGQKVAVPWEETASIDIPQWRGLHDYLRIWRR